MSSEIFDDDIVRQRFTKDLGFSKADRWKKARDGEIQHFTGVPDLYEIPTNPDLIVKTSLEPQAESLSQILRFLTAKGYVPSLGRPN